MRNTLFPELTINSNYLEPSLSRAPVPHSRADVPYWRAGASSGSLVPSPAACGVRTGDDRALSLRIMGVVARQEGDELRNGARALTVRACTLCVDRLVLFTCSLARTHTSRGLPSLSTGTQFSTLP